MFKTWYGFAENNAALNYSCRFLFVCRWADFHALPIRGRTGRLRAKNSRQPSFNQDLPHQHQGPTAQANQQDRQWPGHWTTGLGPVLALLRRRLPRLAGDHPDFLRGQRRAKERRWKTNQTIPYPNGGGSVCTAQWEQTPAVRRCVLSHEPSVQRPIQSFVLVRVLRWLKFRSGVFWSRSAHSKRGCSWFGLLGALSAHVWIGKPLAWRFLQILPSQSNDSRQSPDAPRNARGFLGWPVFRSRLE